MLSKRWVMSAWEYTGLGRDLGFAMLWWFAYMIVLVAYCSAYEALVNAKRPDIGADVLWYLREWGLWLVLAPVLLCAYRRQARESGPLLVKLLPIAVVAFLLALLLRLLLAQAAGEVSSLAQGLVLFAPRYLIGLALLTLMWAWLNRQWLGQMPPSEKKTSSSAESSSASFMAYKGRDLVSVEAASILYVIAARNYVELFSEEACYLLRSTLKEVENQLPAGEFIRTHRSALARRSAIRRYRSLPAGNGVALLDNGAEVPLSRNFMSQLQAGV